VCVVPENTVAPEVANRIAAIMAGTFDVGEIAPGTEFTDLGLDSLVLVELAVIMQREFGVAVTDEELAERGSVAAAADLVAEKRLGS
jgi:acyl carrier protein